MGLVDCNRFVILHVVETTLDQALISLLISENFGRRKPIESELVQPCIDARAIAKTELKLRRPLGKQ